MQYIFERDHYQIRRPVVKKYLLLTIIPLIFLMYGCDRVPEFKSSPVTTAYEGSEYRYELNAVDPDGKSISFFLIEGPEGMMLNKDDVIVWTPDAYDYGNHTIKIKADDSVKFTIQEFTLSVHYQVVGKISFLNLSNESLYPSPGLTVYVSGGNINTSAVSGSDGVFTLAEVPPGEYRYDIVSSDPMAWSFYSTQRELTFIYPARIWWGSASISGTLNSNVTGTKTLSLAANSRSVNLADGAYAFRLDGLFATNFESIVAKQTKTFQNSLYGLRVSSWYPYSYTYIYPVYLEDGQELKYDILLTERDLLKRNLWFVTDGSSYKFEKFGYARMAASSYQMDLSTYTFIENWSSPNAPMPAGERWANFNVGFGQNHDRSYMWYGSSGWSPYKAYNYATGDSIGFELGYPTYPSVASGVAVPETNIMGLMKAEEPESPLLQEDSQKDLSAAELPQKIETHYDVIKGVGLTPTFRWWGPSTTERNPQLYVVTVVEVNSSNVFVRTVWKGMVQKGEMTFPNLSTPLLESGKRYVFYVTVFAGESNIMNQDNVLWYPEDMNYWFSRSAGVVFEP
jgi:hypothetical protein